MTPLPSLGAAICVAAALSAACSSSGSSAGHSMSYRKGFYDGTTMSASPPDPATIARQCEGNLRTLVQGVKAGVLDDTAGSPAFTMKISEIVRADYVAGCRAALTAKYDREPSS